MIVALDPPDFRTISDFRKRHLKALGELFLQVLKLCETAGLVKLGHVALDGTKIKANASKHKAMSYERMKKREAELKAVVACMLAAAEAADAQEDETFGKDKRGDEMPDWASDKEKRLAKIQEAMAALEAEAKLAAEEERRIEAEKDQQRNAEGRKKPVKQPEPPRTNLIPRRNATSPIRTAIMKSKEGFDQAYNAQAAVTLRPGSLSRTNSRSAAAIRANWCPWSRPSRTISAASQSRPQRTLATAANPI